MSTPMLSQPSTGIGQHPPAKSQTDHPPLRRLTAYALLRHNILHPHPRRQGGGKRARELRSQSAQTPGEVRAYTMFCRPCGLLELCQCLYLGVLYGVHYGSGTTEFQCNITPVSTSFFFLFVNIF